jgi:hypothetical protein
VKPAIDPVILSQVCENPELTNEETENLNAIRNETRVAIGSLLKDDGILVIPTLPAVPPKLGSKEITSEDYQNRASSLLSIASISGCCQVKSLSFSLSPAMLVKFPSHMLKATTDQSVLAKPIHSICVLHLSC